MLLLLEKGMHVIPMKRYLLPGSAAPGSKSDKAPMKEDLHAFTL